MKTAKRFTNFKQRALSLLGFCGLGLLLGLQAPYGVAAPSTTLSDNPMILVTPTHPQVLLLLNSSQSMDGNLSGAIMTGTTSGVTTGTYTIPPGFTPPVDGSNNYTVGGKDNSDSRMNVAKASIKQILSDYAGGNDFGLMTLGTSGSPGLYNTWVYYMSPSGGFTFTDTADNVNHTTYPNPCYPFVINSSDCAALAARYGSGVTSKHYFVAAGSSDGTSGTPGSSDDPQVNDVLYAGSIRNAFVSYGGPSPSNPYSGYTLAQYNSGSVFEGYSNTTPNIGGFGTSPTNAGYVPFSPEVLYVSRGFGYYNNIDNTGKLVMPVAVDSASRQTSFNNLLAPETNNAGSSEIKSNAVNAATAGMLNSALKYYSGTYPGYPTPPTNNGCDTKKYVVLVTDGLPTWDLAGKAWPPLGSLSATGYGVTAPTDSNGAVITSGAGATNNQAVIDAVNKIKALKDANILTYVIGMGAGVDATKNPAAAATLKAMAVAGGTTDYFKATTPADVSNDMVVILEQIKANNATTTSAAVNSTNLKTTSTVFQATFNSQDTQRDWTGDLAAYPITNGVVTTTATWDGQALLDTLNLNTGWNTSRKIITFNPTLNANKGAGAPFRWPSIANDPNAISDAQKLLLQPSDALGSDRLNYLRGNKSLEQNAGTFRKRSHLLGDIANSTPLYVGAPAGPYPDSSYQTFQAAKKDRDPMIYVGANDGMLHAFCANTNASGCTKGTEMFAFIPNGVFSRLINLTQPTYNTAHKFYVDGSPSAGDVQFSNLSWHTILTGGLNNGGNSIYAIDVTTPSASDTEATIAGKVLWEFTDAKLGMTYSRPTTARIKISSGSKFVVIFGSGYNNSDGKPYLYMVDAQTGAPETGSPIDLCASLPSTCDGTKANGLSSVSAVSPDGSGTVTLIYAGDLQGNLWKVKQDPTNLTWASTLVFKAKDASGTPQPITTTPAVSLHPNAPSTGGYMVYFGTGRFLGLPDISDTSQQTVYGIWDDPSASTAPTRANLQVQTITSITAPKTLVSGALGVRAISNTMINWPTQKGWYIDLPTSGERAITDVVLDSKRLIFTTFIPSTDPCTGVGQSWLMIVDYATGGAPTKTQIDIYGDGTFPKVKDTNGNDVTPIGILFNYYIAAPTVTGGTDGHPDILLVQGNAPSTISSNGGGGGGGGGGGCVGPSCNYTPITPVNILGGTTGRASWIQVQ